MQLPRQGVRPRFTPGWDRLRVTSPHEDAVARRDGLGRGPGADAGHVSGMVEPVTPRASILICTVPRSGSWLLAEALEDTGVCGHPREYFRPDYQPGYARSWGLAVESLRGYVTGALEAGTTPDGTFAAKLHWGQMAALLHGLRAESPTAGATTDAGLIATHFPAARYVYLSRDDKARQAISLYKAIHLDVWWTFADDEGVEIPPSRTLPREPDFAEIARLEATLRDHELCWTRFFEQGGIDPIRVRYTDIATAYEGTVTAVCDALDRPRQGRPIVRPRLRRQADAVTDDWERRYRDSGVARCGTA